MSIKTIEIDSDVFRLLTDSAARRGYTLRTWLSALSGIEDLKQIEERKDEITSAD